MTVKRDVYVSVILVVLIALLSGCGATEAPAPTSPPEPAEAAAAPADEPAPTEAPEPTATETSEEDAEPVILWVGGLQDVDCWNPFSCTAIYMWGDLSVEGFTDQGPASEGCPGLPAIAEAWERSEDGLTWTVDL